MAGRTTRPRTLARDNNRAQNNTSTVTKGSEGRIGKRTNDGSSKFSRASQKTVMKALGLGKDVSMKEARPAPRASASRGPQIDIKVTGWEKSKASGEKDGGVGALIKWLEKKASTKLSSRARVVKIKKTRVEGNDLIISIPQEDALAILRLNTWQWAGINIKVERLDGAAGEEGSNKDEVATMLRSVLERRYNPDQKLLDLSALGQDEDLQNAKIFDTRSTTNKFFRAMMALLERCFDTPSDKDAAITSVSLANNELSDLSQVSTLSITLPKIHNLDLSNNKFEKLDALSTWRRRFYHLRHIILAGNTLETNEPDFHKELLKWYPNLRVIDQVEVRTEEDIAKSKKFSYPAKAPVFNDQDNICQNFIRNLIAGFDNDRPGLAAYYYDDKSQFSYSVNTSALRDKDTNPTDRQEWSKYINGSRNLKKITQLPAREKRLARGTQAITDAFTALPKSKHPDLDTEGHKYMIEANVQPNIPDPAGASPMGVDGFLVSIHGEFDETESGKKRSFDRTIILGPGGSSGVRVVSDLFTIRAYGGVRAFDATHFAANSKTSGVSAPAQTEQDNLPQLPAGLTLPAAEEMVMTLSKQTNLTVAMAKDCLENAGWNMETAMALFVQVQGTLPPTAFIQPV